MLKTYASGKSLGQFTSGSVLFAGTSGAVSQDNANFNWNNSTKHLGVGMTADAARVLAVGGEILLGVNNKGIIGVLASGSQVNMFNVDSGNNVGFGTPNNGAGAGTIFYSGGDHIFFTTASNTERVRIKGINGRVGIGVANPSAMLSLKSGGNTNGLMILSAYTDTSFWTFASNYDNTNSDLLIGNQVGEKARIDSSGRFGIGNNSPSAFVHIKAGTTAANSAPLKLTTASAALNSTPEAGAIETDGTDLFFTNNAGVRKKVTIV